MMVILLAWRYTEVGLGISDVEDEEHVKEKEDVMR